MSETSACSGGPTA